MMTRSPGVPRTAVLFARWGLPWICAVILSASLAYAMDNALGGPSARQTQIFSSAPLTTDGPSVPERHSTSLAELTAADSDARDGCDTSGGRLLYVGLNTWVPAEAKVAPCPDGGS